MGYYRSIQQDAMVLVVKKMRMRYTVYLLKWALILALPVPLIWWFFSVSLLISFWPLRAAVIWLGIWAPLTVLTATIDYARTEQNKREWKPSKSARDATIDAHL